MKRVIGTSWCLLLAACSSTVDPISVPSSSPTTVQATEEATGLPAAEAVRVFRDPVTGELRAPTEQDLSRLQAESFTAPTERIQVIRQADGTEMLIMQSEKKMDFMQACRQADGSLVMDHDCDRKTGTEK